MVVVLCEMTFQILVFRRERADISGTRVSGETWVDHAIRGGERPTRQDVFAWKAVRGDGGDTGGPCKTI